MKKSIKSSEYRSERSVMMGPPTTRSPFRILMIIALSVVVCETVVMIIISFLPAFSIFMKILLDSTLLIILLSPLLYAFLFRPLIRNSEDFKQANEELRENEKKYRILFENSKDPIYITTREGDIIDANQSHLDLFGFTREEIFEWKAQDTYANPDDRFRFKKELEENGSVKDFEVKLKKKDGTEMDCLITATVRRSKGGDILGYQGIIRDITERKQTEEALQESELWVRNIFKSLKEAVFVITPDRIFLDMNEAALEIFGYTKEELVNLPSEITHVDHEHYLEFGKKMEEVIQKGEISNFQFKLKRKNGEIFPSEHTASLMSDNEGKPIGIVSVVRDLSEQKKIEKEKENLQAQLQQARKMEAIATLAGGIAHEFNNALTGVIGNIELLELRLPDNRIVTEHTEVMKSSSHRMANLTGQLLAYARGGKYQAKIICLSDFVEETLPVIKPDIKPSIHIETDLPRDVFKVNFDSAQLQMVLSALMSNSSEAIKWEGRIRISISNEEIDAAFAKNHLQLNPGSYVCLAVEDDGKGMDEDTLNRIFDPFYTTKFIGRGLGMAAVYGIIRNHGGSISVESDIGKGTVVKIHLPAIEDKEEQVLEKPSEAARVASGPGTILVIEDEETVMNVIRDILDKLGYRILSATTGKEAIEISKTFDGQIDLALLDIKLPDIWGDEVYPQIMKARPDLKVIVCSGYSIDGPAQAILDAGAQDFIQKPFSVKALSKKLKEVLEGK